MQCILINLDNKPERFQQVKENFERWSPAEWSLCRQSAVGIEQVISANVPGRSSLPEKGCFLSHLVAINRSRQSTGHLMIVEDDVLFSEKSFEAIESALSLASNHAWDILFTDICVPHMPTMLDLYSIRKGLVLDGKLSLVPLDKIVFAGSTAYIVNEASKEKFHQIFSEFKTLDVPYDLAIRSLVYQKRLNGFVIFPFPTSLSEFADDSQIQCNQSQKVADIAWNAFRRLVWLGGSTEVAREKIDQIDESYFDAECQVFTKVLACMISSNFVSK
jgi:Glycosyltransferase involved in LPS biosynthesis